jgi:hypothetical protein
MAVAKRTSKRIFTYDEALETFPLVRDLTAAAIRQVDVLIQRARGSQDPEAEEEGEGQVDARRAELDEACQKIVDLWTREIVAVGCEVKGLWLVDWDSGDGYWCWRFPEESISYFHTYEEGFAGRIPVN